MRMLKTTSSLLALLCLFFLTQEALNACAADPRLMVKMTLVRGAAASGAFCLDGSLPGYHLHRGSGAGADKWLLQFEGGGWCNDLPSCLERAPTRRGSTRYMNAWSVFSGILSSNASLNPDFYNWNRVKLRYCDGGSFVGDAMFKNTTSRIYFRGMKIWQSIIHDLLPKGLRKAKKALLSGCSAGGLAALLHCENFTRYLPFNVNVKCLSDGGFFLDAKDINGNYTMRSLYKELMVLQGIRKSLGKTCRNSLDLTQCFFPQYVLKNTRTPFFILNSAYDVFQFHHILVPFSADVHGHWKRCKNDPTTCNANQINILQGFRREMLAALEPYRYSKVGGMFINSCFAHCQSESQDTWLAGDSPRVHNKTIAQAIGDWYFNRNVTKEIDCAYPCDKTCHNLIPGPSDVVA